LEEGADVNLSLKDGSTALTCAASQGHPEIMRALLEKGADVNAKSRGNTTALMYAASDGYTDIVELLLERGADVNAKYTGGSIDLTGASRLYTGVPPVKREAGSTALIYAARHGHTEIVRLLLANGADVNARDGLGKSALMYAAYGKHDRIIQLLKKPAAKE
jgi:ankyrin repeat protein